MGITELAPLVVSLLGASAATYATLYTLRAERRRKDAEAEQAEEQAHTAATSRQQLEQEITERVLARARADMDSMRVELAMLRAELAMYRAWNSRLQDQIISAGLVPVRMPDKETL